MPEQVKILGIVGGLGPYAHVDFELKVLAAARGIVGSDSDQSYPEWILSSVPQTPDRTLAIQGRAGDPVPWLLRSLRHLELAGADFAAMPCNTAHHYLDELRASVHVPILDMIALTADTIARDAPGARVGVLATTGTLQADVYGAALRARGLTPVSLLGFAEAQERLVMAPIYGPGGIKAVGATDDAAAALTRAFETLVNELGASVVIAGCTEAPLALPRSPRADVALIDPGRVLAEACVRVAYGLEEVC